MEALPKLTDRDKVRMALDEAYRTMDFSTWCTHTMTKCVGVDENGDALYHHCALGHVNEILCRRWEDENLLHRTLDEAQITRIARVNDTQGLLPVRILMRDMIRGLAS